MGLFKSAVIFLTFSAVQDWGMGAKIQQFLLDNGHHHVDLFYNSSQWLGFSLKDVYVARFSMEHVDRGHQDSFGIFIFDSGKDDIVSFISAIIKRKVKLSLLVLFTPGGHEFIDLTRRHLLDLQASAYFYLAMIANSSEEMIWQKIMSLKSGVAINKLVFGENSSRIIESFDLQGLQITSTSLTESTKSYLTIDGCNEFGLQCDKNYGYLIDIMDDLAFHFNFTYLSQRNVDNEWGSFGINGTYGGVLGDVINKKYDMSLSYWWQNLATDELLDFVPLRPYEYGMALKPQYPNFDYGLFTRAFEGDTLYYIAAMTIPAVCLALLVNQCGLDESMNSVLISSFILWLFFTLVNSYYCGVLTMFFATRTPVPFKTVGEAIRAYPDWKYRFKSGDQSYIHSQAEDGISDYIILWKRYQANPSDTIYKSVEHGLQLIEEGKNVIDIDRQLLLAHLKSNPTKQDIHFVLNNKEQIDYANIILEKNSPLLPMFLKGLTYLKENGLERQIFYRWFGEFNGEKSSTENVLTFGQMVLVFVMMMVVFVIALFVLCAELAFKNHINRM